MINLLDILNRLGIAESNAGVSTGTNTWHGKGGQHASVSPVNGLPIASVSLAGSDDYEKVITAAHDAFPVWRQMPAPKRGEIVRQMGDQFRLHKTDLGTLVSYEMGKSLQEGLGEVQEIIDICDFATGLSRQLYGLTMHSERPAHRMYEQWHPIGVVGIISAFNFPVAVWSWNAMIAWVCGNTCIWKPSEKTPLSALACQHIIRSVLVANNLPEGISSLIVGDQEIGKQMAGDPRIALVSATGSTRMGKAVAKARAGFLGKCLLELGGNNAIILTSSADLAMAIPAVVFGAVGTAGQRCTSTRRLLVQRTVWQEVKQKLVQAYAQLKIGNPLDESNHLGPLIDREAVAAYTEAIAQIEQQGGRILTASGRLEGPDFSSGCYVRPVVAEAENHWEIVQQETFAPILYLIPFETLEEGIALQNDVPQGLSSAIFTQNIRESELFLSHAGSDCGIANVNIGTSGAEIGGAFGGEKETGGGREAGSDAWRVYMRRQTNTINFGESMPLAQGIRFEIG